MTLSQIKYVLKAIDQLNFKIADGSLIPNHFHITEVGKIIKDFIDCGGVLRKEEHINFQLWYANDYEHRLTPEKLLSIIEVSEEKLSIPDLEIEVEYQTDSTIGKFDLDFDGKFFLLVPKKTNCLAIDKCGIPSEKQKTSLSELKPQDICAPGSGCC